VRECSEIDIIGVPLDLGVRELGLRLGPDALRQVGLVEVGRRLGLDDRDLGNIEPPYANGFGEAHPRPALVSGAPSGGQAASFDELSVAVTEREDVPHTKTIAAYCRKVAATVAESVRTGRLPVCLGGDHSLAIGSVAGVASEVGLVGCFWVDAHPDANTPKTSPSGNIHGMPVAIIAGEGPQELLRVGARRPLVACRNLFLLGTRDIDPGELAFIQEHDIGMYTVFDILERGLPTAVDRGIERVTANTAGVHVSLDLDVLHEGIAPGVGIPSRCGLTMREATYVCRRLASECRITSVDVIGLNPVRDRGMGTAKRAAELLLALLGRSYSFTYEDYLRDQHT